MSGALDRLVRRVRGTLPTVEPMLPSRWEQPTEQAGLTETHSEIVAREETAEPMARRVLPAPAPASAPPQQAVAERPRPVERAVQRKAAPLIDAENPREPPAKQPGVAARPVDAASARFEPIPPTPSSPTRHDDANRGRSPRPAVPEPEPVQPVRQHPQTREVVPPDDPRRPDNRSSVPWDDRSPAPRDVLLPQPRDRPALRWPEAAAPPSPPPAPTAPESDGSLPAVTVDVDAGHARTPEPVPPRPAPPRQTLVRSPAGQRDVHVTIGRVEVHPPPQAPEPMRAPAATRPRISLEDYQRQRRERGR